MSTLDLYFPFIVLVYGSVMTIATNIPFKSEVLEAVPEALLDQFYGHRTLGYFCFFVGLIWSLQRIFVS